MDTKVMTETARAMVAAGKGLLAADESAGTCKKRFDSVKVECTEENRRAYRELLFTTPKINEYVSGVILFDETLRQSTKDGTNFGAYLAKNGIIPGIKVDAGAHDMPLHPGEKVTEGLDKLPQRMKEYFDMGARFAKWRAVITIEADRLPSRACLVANAHALARYSAACQEHSIVPIVEPEVLLDGNHSAERSEAVHEETLELLFHELQQQGVSLEHTILKASMCVSGKDNAKQAGVQEVAERTLRVLKRTVPAALPGVVFLSGGQTDENATAHLDAMNRMGAPWPLTFSYSRALQAVALKAWSGQAANVAAAQKAFQHRARMNSLAAKGQWKAELEKQTVAT
jgi:fructose-bisphosphate aldolase, class I